MYVKLYQNASTKMIVGGNMGILEITQRQHNTHTKTVLRDKFVKSYELGCADFAGGQSSFCLRYAKVSRVLLVTCSDWEVDVQLEESARLRGAHQASRECLVGQVDT